MQIFVTRGSQQSGPFSEAEISSQLATGTILRTDFVWWEGQAGWIPLEQSRFVPGHAASGSPPVPADPRTFVAGPHVPSAVAIEKTSGMAIASLVCGLSIILTAVTFLPAIILGHLALDEIRRNPALKGRGMALTGLILGYSMPCLLCFISIISISVLQALGQQVNKTFEQIQSTNQPSSQTPGDGTNTDQPDNISNSDTNSSTTPAAPGSGTTTNAPSDATNSP